MFQTTIAGSLPKPGWLAEEQKLWPRWQLDGPALAEAKRDATLLWLKEQEDAGIDVVSDGEQSRQHFVHGFLEAVEGIDTAHRVTMGIRNNRYQAEVPVVTGPLRLRGRAHATEARIARAHTRRWLKFTLPGPMTIVDTVADRHYGDRAALAMAFAELLNHEARALVADTIRAALAHVPRERLWACTNCGMAPMRRDVARAKLAALAAGAALARSRHG